MVTGTPEYDAVKLRQIDPFTSEALLTHGGGVFGVATRVISHDGKSMTITFGPAGRRCAERGGVPEAMRGPAAGS